MEEVQIGNVKIERSACLGPMASVADRPYRLMCKEYGASYCVGEMASAKALTYSDLKTARLLTVTPEEEPMGIQLFGNSPETMARAAELAMHFSPRLIDVNMGCPVPKVAGTGCGSALMKTPDLAFDIVRAMVRAVPVPITVKFRTGWDDEHKNAVEFAKRMEDAGAAAITVHGRTKKQMYLPPIDLLTIKEVKNAVSIPVIGNGGVYSGKDAKEMYDKTGCDLVMVAQGSLGRPWIFKEIRHYLLTGETLPEPSLNERMDVLLRHAQKTADYYGEKTAMRLFRKHAAWYIRGARGANAFRRDCGTLTTFAQLQSLVEKVKESSL